MRGVSVDELTVTVTIKGKPYYFHGDDQIDKRAVEFIEKIGGQAIITPYIEGISSTKMN